MLFLVSDTGGGHRRAAEAVISSLAGQYPAGFRPVVVDPLAGPGASAPLRFLVSQYGPVIRRAPWAWGVAYYLSNSWPAMAVLGRTVFAAADRMVLAAVAAAEPAVIVSCHPLTGRAAVHAARRGRAVAIPVVTVVTDLAAPHAAWFRPAGDLVVVPTAKVLARTVAAGVPPGRCTVAGLPVAAAGAGYLGAAAGDRAALRRSLGLDESRFTVLLMGGGEGSGGLARHATAILRRAPDVHVVTICGRNVRLQRRLMARAARGRGRLTVLGFTTKVADWLACADLVITKAGPGVIAEAACCGAPLLLTSHLPGQERGNAALVEQAGAGLSARGVRRMLRELARLQADPAALAAMRAGSRALARPHAAADTAAIVARAAAVPAPDRRGDRVPVR